MTSTPSMPGRPEVEDDRVGVVAGRQVERRLAVGGEVDVVAADAQVDAERAADLGLVVDDEDAAHPSARGKRHRHGEPAARGVVDAELGRPSPRRTRGRPPGRARRRRRCGLSPSRWNGWNIASRCSAAHAGPAVDDAQVDRRPEASRPTTRTGWSRGDHCERVLDHVGDGPLEEAGVGVHPGQRLGDVEHDPARARRAARPGPAARPLRSPRRGSTGSSVPGLQPAHVEEVVDEGGEPVRRRGRSSRAALAAPRAATRRPAAAGSSPTP